MKSFCPFAGTKLLGCILLTVALMGCKTRRSNDSNIESTYNQNVSAGVEISESLIEMVPAPETLSDADPALCFYGKTMRRNFSGAQSKEQIEQRFGSLPLLVPVDPTKLKRKSSLKIEDNKPARAPAIRLSTFKKASAKYEVNLTIEANRNGDRFFKCMFFTLGTAAVPLSIATWGAILPLAAAGAPAAAAVGEAVAFIRTNRSVNSNDATRENLERSTESDAKRITERVAAQDEDYFTVFKLKPNDHKDQYDQEGVLQAIINLTPQFTDPAAPEASTCLLDSHSAYANFDEKIRPLIIEAKLKKIKSNPPDGRSCPIN